MTEDQMKQRTREFAVKVIQAVENLPRTTPSMVIGRQIIRSATSVGANYRSACRARSKPDFISKLAVAEEESDETQYWLELLHDLRLIDVDIFRSMHQEADELTRILASSGKTAKGNIVKR